MKPNMPSLAAPDVALVVGLTLYGAIAHAESAVIPAAGPVFGVVTAPDGSFLIADTGSGPIEYRHGRFAPLAQLPGATDVAAIGRGNFLVLTSGGFGGDGRLYRVSRGSLREVADIAAVETTVNPDGADVNPNPFDVAVLDGSTALVTDAGGNSLLVVGARGDVDWVATLPPELVSTANIKSLLGCPGSGAPQCGWPPMIPAQAVATSIAIGPDGTLYALELEENSWFALDLPPGKAVGGSLNACDVAAGTCDVVASGLFMATAVAVGKDGTPRVVTNGLIPGAAVLSTVP
jgi:hypothetical protein